LEFALFQPSHVDADVTVFAGDVHTGTNGLKWILQTYRDKPVVYVLGNHEFYGQKIQKLVAKLKELAAGSTVHVLDNDRVEIGGVVFLGTTLWTDFCLYGDPVKAERLARWGMNDFQKIRIMPTFRRFLPKNAREFHAHSLEWMRREASATQDKGVVVVSHHAPSPKSIPASRQDDPLNVAYASNLEPFIADIGPALWIHGHIHHRAEYMVGRTRVISNPRGHKSEPDSGFDPFFVAEV
jgi:Icc-related predicted phosphoesterase